MFHHYQMNLATLIHLAVEILVLVVLVLLLLEKILLVKGSLLQSIQTLPKLLPLLVEHILQEKELYLMFIKVLVTMKEEQLMLLIGEDL